MIAFEVFVNGERICTAGVGDLGVLSGLLTWVRRAPENSSDGKSFDEELTFDVTGLNQRAHVTWLHRKLSIGDSVTLKVVSAARADSPASSEPREDATAVEKGERRYFEHLQKKYGRKRAPAKRRQPARPKPRKTAR